MDTKKADDGRTKITKELARELFHLLLDTREHLKVTNTLAVEKFKHERQTNAGRA